jgi:hypothetical protein
MILMGAPPPEEADVAAADDADVAAPDEDEPLEPHAASVSASPMTTPVAHTFQRRAPRWHLVACV